MNTIDEQIKALDSHLNEKLQEFVGGGGGGSSIIVVNMDFNDEDLFTQIETDGPLFFKGNRQSEEDQVIPISNGYMVDDELFDELIRGNAIAFTGFIRWVDQAVNIYPSDLGELKPPSVKVIPSGCLIISYTYFDYSEEYEVKLIPKSTILEEINLSDVDN